MKPCFFYFFVTWDHKYDCCWCCIVVLLLPTIVGYRRVLFFTVMATEHYFYKENTDVWFNNSDCQPTKEVLPLPQYQGNNATVNTKIKVGLLFYWNIVLCIVGMQPFFSYACVSLIPYCWHYAISSSQTKLYYLTIQMSFTICLTMEVMNLVLFCVLHFSHVKDGHASFVWNH